MWAVQRRPGREGDSSDQKQKTPIKLMTEVFRYWTESFLTSYAFGFGFSFGFGFLLGIPLFFLSGVAVFSFSLVGAIVVFIVISFNWFLSNVVIKVESSQSVIEIRWKKFKVKKLHFFCLSRFFPGYQSQVLVIIYSVYNNLFSNSWENIETLLYTE